MVSRSQFNRRRFLGRVAGSVAAAGVPSLLSRAIADAAAVPAAGSSIGDVKHVVILMQENRSFDHYYGTMRGVRGFGDRFPLPLSTRNDVFHQPDSARTDGGYLLPFHLDTRLVDGQDLGDLGHGWTDQHTAANGGAMNSWVSAKGENTMGYFTATDLPLHRALAGAFTIGDNYHCSVLGPTTPNRLYHWTGTIDAAGSAGGPANNNPPDYNPVYRWTTYPERLQAAKIDWKVYANQEVGDNGSHPWVGDYGDNPLWLFQAYWDSLHATDPAATDLARRASVTGTWAADSGQGYDPKHVLSSFLADVSAGTLPSVSWVVAPYGYTEHPAARPVDGQLYVQTMLNALWAKPDLWASTVVIINYDENDGFFDHVVPPMPPAGTADEFVGSLPIGLGYRVPLTVVSPWSAGGYVNSQLADHTSVLRFLENWTGVRETNISAWRRSVCGDLMSCFNFAGASTIIPMLPDMTAARAVVDATASKLPAASRPAVGMQALPLPEAGSRPARAVPYAIEASGRVTAGDFYIDMTNASTVGVFLATYPNNFRADGPWYYTLDAGTAQSDYFVAGTPSGAYDLSTFGPNGFYRRFVGNRITATGSGVANPEVKARVDGPAGTLTLTMTNTGSVAAAITVIANAYRADGPWTFAVAPNATVTNTWTMSGSANWYDLTATANTTDGFLRRFAGHAENGQASTTDPAVIGLLPATVKYVDSQETAAENGAAANATDGDPRTLWHTQYTGTAAPLPHEIQLDTGGNQTLTGFTYLPRQDGGVNGRIGRYECYVSTDGTSWGTAVATGSFADDASTKLIRFAPTAGRYLRLRALTEAGNRGPWTAAAEIGVLGIPGAAAVPPHVLSRTGWTVKYVDSQETAAENGAAANAIDANNATFWHSRWSTSPAPLPHEIQLDMQTSHSVSGLSYLPRQDGSANGRIGQYEVYVSADGTTWGTAAATGRFTDDATVKTVSFAPVTGRYVRLRALTEAGNRGPWTAAAEINVIGL